MKEKSRIEFLASNKQDLGCSVFEEVEGAEEQIPIWDGHKRKTRDMAWCNDSKEERPIQIISPISSDQDKSLAIFNSKVSEIQTITCPSCGHKIEIHDQSGIVHDLPGLPAGVKFDPTDQEILEHLDAKVHSGNTKLHPLIDEFIPSLEGDNGICYTHPERLPGVSRDGQIRHFFHRPSKAYATGTRKRRKVHTDEDGGETRWHKTGKTKPVFAGGVLRGFKKILVLYTNYGRQRKPEKTSWVMHQYHLGDNEEEKDGELVVSKVFFQTQPRQCSSSIKEYSPQKQQSTVLERYDNCPMIKNSNFVEYYNPPFISYDVGSQTRENPPHPQLIQNLVIHGDSSPFINNIQNSESK